LKITLISLGSVAACLAILFTVYFAIRNSNMKKHTYPYWGMGIAIENGVEEYTFFGNLKRITAYDDIGQISAVADFVKGNCIKETAYTKEGEIDYYYSHEYENGVRILSTYNDEGQLVLSAKYEIGGQSADGLKTEVKTERTYYLEENRIEQAVLILGEDGNLLEETVYEKGEKIRFHKYAGTLITETNYYAEGEVFTGKQVFEYNDKKQVLTETLYDAKNVMQSRTVNQYNNKGLLNKTMNYDNEGKILSYTTYNYDLNNNPIKQTTYDGNDAMTEQIVRSFNNKNRVIKETCLRADGSIVYCNGYDYNEKGFVSKAITYNTENSTIIDQYTIYTRSDSGAVTESKSYNSINVLIENLRFNDAGFITQQYRFNDAGTLILEVKNQYDDKQRKIQVDTVSYSDSGSIVETRQEKFNEKGQIVILTQENIPDETYQQILFEYHQAGWVCAQTYYEKNGKTASYLELNSDGTIKSETAYENGAEAYYYEYSYDQNGRTLERKALDMAAGELITTTYFYDKNGVLKSSEDRDTKKQILRSCQYDEMGLTTLEIVYGEEGEVSETWMMEYDSEGRIIQKERYDEEGVLVTRQIFYYGENDEYYVIFDGNGTVIEDSRGEEFLPEENPEEDNTDSDDTDSSENSGSSESSDSTDVTDSETSDTSDPSDGSDPEGDPSIID